MYAEEVIERLRILGSESFKKGLERYAVPTEDAFGVRMPDVRKLAKELGVNHALACELWESGYHEARILAALIAEPALLDFELMEKWLSEFDSWDVCDQCCMNLFRKHPQAFELAVEWSAREREFEKRAGFALMASLAVHAKHVPDEKFDVFFQCIEVESYDNRNFVKKAANWALRQMGKRNAVMLKKAVNVSKRLIEREEKAAKWIGRDALRELKTKL